MAFVIAEPCVGVKDTACVDVCPVDAIHPRAEEHKFASAAQLYIDPENCICCAACVSACPVQAIFDESELPKQWQGFAELNASWFSTMKRDG
jgi:NAD-dependent dihydropyrimidine dehydrogenase PreA subunit